jgi:hypothetical protein
MSVSMRVNARWPNSLCQILEYTIVLTGYPSLVAIQLGQGFQQRGTTVQLRFMVYLEL